VDHYDPEWLIEQMGLPRFLLLSQRTGHDLGRVFALHQRDTKLREILRTELEILEIAVRNRYHAALRLRRPQNQTWLLDENLPARRILQTRYHKVFKQLNAKEISPSEALEGLSFGFWAQLTSRNLEHSMWTPYIRHVYPQRTRRESVHRRVEEARLLRNRASHIDMVLDQPLFQQWQTILWLLDRLNPGIAEERRQSSELPGLIG
jgi:hypothetical protein